MVEELNNLLKEYDNDNIGLIQLWNEYKYKQCQEILDKFNDNDWNTFVNSLSTKSNDIKIKLANIKLVILLLSLISSS